MAVVLAFLQGLCQRLQSTIAASDQLPLGVNKELEGLLKAFRAIQVTTVKAAENKQSKSKAVRTWLRELKAAAYDADDLLDCLVLKAQEPEVEASGREVVDQHCCLIFNCGEEHPATQTELIMIQDIRRRVQKLMRKKPFSLHLYRRRSSNLMSNQIESIEATTPNSGEFGRDKDKEKLVELLKSDESSQVYLSLVAIVGREGVGKTTLARIVYNDKEVTSYFNLKLWITASEIYDSESLSTSIMSSTGGRGQVNLDAQLVAGRSLLVFDDVRNENIEWEAVWEKLQLAQNGSKILITTENEQFVNKMRLPSTSYHLKGLLHGDCWSLFRQCSNLEAAASNQSTTQLEEVGMKIAEKLEGLPLAARLLGSLLCCNANLNDWKMILDDEVLDSKPKELCGIPAALWLSYQHLPQHIKPCFSYCSLFPRDHMFDKDDLIQMWMAHGLIQPQPGRQIEETGNEYFIYLIQRSLLQSSEREYMMHSLVHSLAMVVTADESLCLRGTDTSSNQCEKVRARHLSLQSGNLEISKILDSGMLNNLRTLFFYQTVSSNFEYNALFAKLKCVRVLCLSDERLINLPESFGNLKQLRYLDLSETAISTLPDVLCSLYNLQTLKLGMSLSWEPLAKCTPHFVNLRHLKGNSDNISKIYKIGNLKFLQELEQFSVIREDGHRIEELKDMKQLRGVLRISDLYAVHTEEEAKQAKLNEKEHISKLELHWTWTLEKVDISKGSDDLVLEGLQPHQNLKELEIFRYGGAKTPSWLQCGYLTNLEALEIRSCENCDLRLSGQLRCLKFLKIHGMRKLQQLGCGVCEEEEENHHLFPHLRALHLIDCYSLMELIPLPSTLEELKLDGVGLAELPRLHQNKSGTPSSSSLLSLHISNCHSLTTLESGLLRHQNQHQLQVLETLNIEHCSQLFHLPNHGFSALESLKLLHIHSCFQLRYEPVENSTATLPSSLINLKITSCPPLPNDSFFMGLKGLQSLDSMFIEWSMPALPTLTSLPEELLQHLKALTQLIIQDCHLLVNVGIQSLVSLKELRIQGCSNLVSCSSSVDTDEPLPLEFLKISLSPVEFINRKLLGRLTSLKELHISNARIVSFPEEIKDGLDSLISLKRLHIQCRALQSLPDELASIPCLEELYITNLPDVRCLPEKGLPASLAILVIDSCPSLRDTCQRGGADWNKIENIFFVRVDGLNVKDLNPTLDF
ncbi:P-loop containing nucleoside triphosphate hydrolase protein [Dioscorea alata]|uniref:P-loop containing nucleoside triphosphate hydrolase protein n=1 Tax=Dioscorea alata TaxID=55571 RepID=A0ACB7VQ30_DIOAL|nr:P-loop containing nucleoside triphosphate hydrolase protein [Dioscorea alata]